MCSDMNDYFNKATYKHVVRNPTDRFPNKLLMLAYKKHDAEPIAVLQALAETYLAGAGRGSSSSLS